MGTFADIHAPAAAFLDQAFIDQLLIALQHRQRIEPVIGGDRPHGGQWITLLESTLQDEGHHSIAQLAIDWLIVVPIRVHSSLDMLLWLYSTLVYGNACVPMFRPRPSCSMRRCGRVRQWPCAGAPEH